MRASLIVVATLALTAPAHAQAPGEVRPAPAPSVMAHRFAVGLELGALGLHRDVEGATDVSFGVGELAGRYRIVRSFELGLSLWGGGAMKGTLSTGGLFIDGRYRFLAERPWNVFASLSLGVVSVADEEAGEDAKAGRGALRFGVGIERRFGALAIEAQLRLMGVGENEKFMPVDLPTPNDAMASDKLSGGALTVGGTYYF
jgi:hypothetical protein